MDIIARIYDICLEEVNIKEGDELKITVRWGRERKYDVVYEKTKIVIKSLSIGKPQININGEAEVMQIEG